VTRAVRRLALLLPFVAPAACAPLIDFDALTSGNGADAGGEASHDATADAPAETGGDGAPSDDADAAAQADVVDAGGDVLDAAPFDAGDPCLKVPSVDNGYYCGTSLMNGFSGGVPNDLYLCVDGSAASTTPCAVDCVTAPLDYPDTCDQCATKPDGTWCGSEFPGYLPALANVKFTCTGGKNNGTPIACVNPTPACHPADGGAACGT
jgi:hypothetical protein